MKKHKIIWSILLAITLSCSQEYPEDISNIVKIQKFKDLTLEFGKSHNLPFEVAVELDNGTKDTIPVKWNGYFNPLKAGDYQISGALITKHINNLSRPENIYLNIKVLDNNYPNEIITGYDKNNFLMSAGPFRVSNLPVSAIDKKSVTIKRTIIDEYEVLFRAIQSEEERKEYEKNTLIQKKFDLDQYALMFHPNESKYNQISSIESNTITYSISIIYRYAKLDVLDNIKLTTDAKMLLDHNSKEFENKYGAKYISSITLGHQWITSMTIGYEQGTPNENIIEDLITMYKKYNRGLLKTDEKISMDKIWRWNVTQNIGASGNVESHNSLTEQLELMKKHTKVNKNFEELYIEYNQLPSK